MAINQIFNNFPKISKILTGKSSDTKTFKWKYFFYLFALICFLSISTLISNTIIKKNEQENKNLDSLTKSEEFLNLSDYLISKINSPYEEIQYLIKNNDSIEKILNRFDIKTKDIKSISNKLKQKKNLLQVR